MYYKLFLVFFLLPIISCSSDDEKASEDASALAGAYDLSVEGAWIGTQFSDEDKSTNTFILKATESDKTDEISFSQYCDSNNTAILTGSWNEDSRSWHLNSDFNEDDIDTTAEGFELNLDSYNSLILSNNNTNDLTYLSFLEASQIKCDSDGKALLLSSAAVSIEACDAQGNGNGPDNLKCAAAYYLTTAIDSPTPATDEDALSSDDPVTTTLDTVIGGNTRTMSCTSNYIEDPPTNLDLSNVALFTTNSKIYAGNILQGDSFVDGSFDDYGLVRSGTGEFTVSGLSIENDPILNTADRGFEVEKITAKNVATGIETYLNARTIKGTTAVGTSQVVKIYSSEQLKVKLGVTVDVGTNGGSLDFDWGTDTTSNYYLATFVQPIYTVSFEYQGDPVDLFEENFTDSSNRLGPDNPPLYISQVTYGRQIYLMIKSELSLTTIQSALGVKVDEGDVNVNVDLEISYSDALESSSMDVFVAGGDAEENTVFKNFFKTSPDGDSILSTLADFMATGTSYNDDSGNVYLPISFGLTYVGSNQTASYSTIAAYVQNDCQIEPLLYWDFQLSVTDIDSKLFLMVDNTKDTTAINSGGNAYNGYIDPGTDNIGISSSYYSKEWSLSHGDDLKDSSDHLIRIQLRNDTCGKSSMKWAMSRGTEGAYDVCADVSGGGPLSGQYWAGISNCQWNSYVVFKINRTKGTCDLVGSDFYWGGSTDYWQDF